MTNKILIIGGWNKLQKKIKPCFFSLMVWNLKFCMFSQTHHKPFWDPSSNLGFYCVIYIFLLWCSSVLLNSWKVSDLDNGVTICALGCMYLVSSHILKTNLLSDLWLFGSIPKRVKPTNSRHRLICKLRAKGRSRRGTLNLHLNGHLIFEKGKLVEYCLLFRKWWRQEGWSLFRIFLKRICLCMGIPYDANKL